jgi:hypothetical protein
MARRKAANPAWNNEAAIRHCVRSFRNNVAVWWEKAVPSDKSPKMLKEITTNWKKFEIIFRQAWKIKATMTSVAGMENNDQKAYKSIAAFVTRVQNAVATTSREALTYKANNVNENDEPKWNNHTEKYLAAQAVYDARAVATPWTPAEKEAIEARKRELGQEQQEAAKYKCRRTMTNVITFEILSQGLTNLLMRTEATKVAGECISTDSFKEKLTQIEEVNQAKPKQAPLHSRSEYINKVGNESNMEEGGVNVVPKGKVKKKGKGKANNGHANAVDEPPPTQRRPRTATGAAGTKPLCSWCKKRGHTYKQCWARDPTLRPPYLQVKSVGNAHGQGNRQDGPRTNNNGNAQNPPRDNVNACSYANCTDNNCNNNKVACVNGHQKDFANGGWY